MQRHLPNSILPLFAFVVSLSFLFSLITIYFDSVINPDGICYLLSAQSLGYESVRSVLHLCAQSQWPFYSSLIFALTKTLSFSYLTSAYVIDAFCSMGSALIFVLIVKEMGGSKTALWLAALTILLHHDLNGLRNSIIRDHGYWLAYLTSIWLMLLYFKKPVISRALGWSISLILAALFRVEAVVFLLLVPIAIFFVPNKSFAERVKEFFHLQLLNIFLFFCLMIWFLYKNEDLQSLGRISEFVQQFHTAWIKIIYNF